MFILNIKKEIPKIDLNNVEILSYFYSVYGIVWTTTPWTLPANSAVCYNDSLEYSLVRKADSNPDIIYIVASELLSSLSNILNWKFEIIDSIQGENNLRQNLILTTWVFQVLI